MKAYDNFNYVHDVAAEMMGTLLVASSCPVLDNGIKLCTNTITSA